MNTCGKTTVQICVAALALLILSGCIAYPVIGYRKYTPEFTGKVTTRDGKPVSGMRVRMWCYDRSWEGQTDATGVFRVPEQGHWYYFVVERLSGIKIYPEQNGEPFLYDFVIRFGEEGEKYFIVGALHDSPGSDIMYRIPTFGGFSGFDLLTFKSVDEKIQKRESAKKTQKCFDYKLYSKSQYFDDFFISPQGNRIYYWKTYLLLKKEDLKDFKIVTDDYVLTLDEVLLNYLLKFSRFNDQEKEAQVSETKESVKCRV